ncbi:DinB family protein [Hanamia caeni]|uniref:DinB family protein n=1 Tax=Hanamia caeni TaxID=2294116 RepID=A0A3M9N859_9BACT|nr:DinB family protein [Hanamia caeni]RNI33403.1 DinB family protein [Hanamia caeni]
MKESIDIIRGARKFSLNLIDGISIEKLNEIPEGFNNNLAWNFAHVIANQQILCYRNAGAKPVISDEIIDKYKTGTRPEGFIDEKEFETFKQFLLSTIDKFEEDSATNIFENYKAFDLKSYPGVRLKNINDAAKFVSFHDGLHVGYSMALKRALKL